MTLFEQFEEYMVKIAEMRKLHAKLWVGLGREYKGIGINQQYISRKVAEIDCRDLKKAMSDLEDLYARNRAIKPTSDHKIYLTTKHRMLVEESMIRKQYPQFPLDIINALTDLYNKGKLNDRVLRAIINSGSETEETPKEDINTSGILYYSLKGSNELISVSHTKVATLTIITPPGTEAISRAIFKPGITWSDMKSKVPTPVLQGAPFQHWSLTCNGDPIDDEHVFDTSSIIYGVFDGTVVVTANTGTEPAQYYIPVVPGTLLRTVVNDLPKFKKAEHSFMFWSIDGAAAADLSTRITDPTTITAVWAADASTIAITINTGSLFKPMETIRVTPGTQWTTIKNLVSYPTPAAESSVFQRWSLTDGGDEITDGSVFNTDTEIFAVGQTATEFIDLVFDPHGGTTTNPLIHQPKGILYGYVKTLVEDPVRKTDSDRFDEFAGWSDQQFADAELAADHAFQQTTTLHAQWVTRIDVTVKNNGEDRVLSQECNYWPYSDFLGKVTCESGGIPEKHTFAHWSLSEDGPDMGSSGMFTQDTSVWAVYDPYAVIAVDQQGGSGADGIEVPINSLWQAINDQILDPTKTENTFSHWSLTPGGDPIPNDHAFTGTETIYAVWVPYVTVTFNTQGGSEVTAIKVPKGSTWGNIKAQAGTTTLEGYRFDRWSLEAAGIVVPDETVFNEENTIVYAIWVKTWQITFDAAGGSPTQAPLTVDDGSTWAQVKSKVTSPSKSGYNFLGWSVVS